MADYSTVETQEARASEFWAIVGRGVCDPLQLLENAAPPREVYKMTHSFPANILPCNLFLQYVLLRSPLKWFRRFIFTKSVSQHRRLLGTVILEK